MNHTETVLAEELGFNLDESHAQCTDRLMRERKISFDAASNLAFKLRSAKAGLAQALARDPSRVDVDIKRLTDKFVERGVDFERAQNAALRLLRSDPQRAAQICAADGREAVAALDRTIAELRIKPAPSPGPLFADQFEALRADLVQALQSSRGLSSTAALSAASLVIDQCMLGSANADMTLARLRQAIAELRGGR